MDVVELAARVVFQFRISSSNQFCPNIVAAPGGCAEDVRRMCRGCAEDVHSVRCLVHILRTSSEKCGHDIRAKLVTNGRDAGACLA